MQRMTHIERVMDAWKEKRILMARQGWQSEPAGLVDFRRKTGLPGFMEVRAFLTGTRSADLDPRIAVVSPTCLACNGWQIEYNSETRMVRISQVAAQQS